MCSKAGPYTLQSKSMALHVLEYFRKKHPSWNEKELEEATAEATAVSISSLQRFKKELKDGRLSSPPSKRMRTGKVMDSLDPFDEACLSRIITSFYERGEIPTLQEILEKAKEAPVNFNGAQTSLYKILRKLGYQYSKVRSGRKILMERQDIVAARCKYLKEIRNNRTLENPRYVVYLDETLINQNEFVAKCWTDNE